jgi:hypothetical protein
MIGGCIRDGIRSAGRRPGLVLLLWAWNLVLGMVVALPAFSWWSGSTSFSRAADAMRDRFDMAVLADIGKYDQLPGFGMLTSTTLGLVIVSLIAGAFVNGGILEVLATDDDRRSLMHRFFRGGGHFFGRFLRLLAATLAAAFVTSGIAAALTAAATKPLAESDWDAGGFVAGIINLVVLAIVWGFFLLAQDYARIRIAADDSPKAMRAWFRSLGFGLRRLVPTFAIGLTITVASGVLLALWLLYDGSASSSTWVGLLALVVVQQAVVFGRIGLRVALVGAERHYHTRSLPPAPVVEARPVAADDAVTAEGRPAPADPHAGDPAVS